jgi:hypothetical protein
LEILGELILFLGIRSTFEHCRERDRANAVTAYFPGRRADNDADDHPQTSAASSIRRKNAPAQGAGALHPIPMGRM